MEVTALQTAEYHPFYLGYINKVTKEVGLLDGYKLGKTQVLDFFKSIPADKLEYRYAIDKWSIKDVFQHIIDNERIFTYRCFRISRQDKTPLAGYDQNTYVEPADASSKTIEDLLEEYETVRQSSIVLLKRLSDDNLKFLGAVSGGDMSARAAAFVTLGHEIHHINIIKERYL